MTDQSLTISELELHHFRSYRRRKFTFDAAEVILSGPNGVGKSNLLEAIYFLSILRSFRTASVRELVAIGEKSFRLRARIAGRTFPETLEVEQTAGGGRRLSIDGNPVRRSSEFIREFRAVAFTPEDKMIAAGSSSCRRKFFDMLISVMEPGYFTALQRYGAALAQRNAALRNPAAPEAAVAAFEPELAAAAEVIAAARRRYAQEVAAKVNALPAAAKEPFEIIYEPDYPETAAGFAVKIAADRERDRKRGFTTAGPQTDEFNLLLNGRNLRTFGSNGQKRLISLDMRMAEFGLFKDAGGRVVALVDDVTGELDAANREHFLELLRSADQTFYTFTGLPGDRRLEKAQHIALAPL